VSSEVQIALCRQTEDGEIKQAEWARLQPRRESRNAWMYNPDVVWWEIKMLEILRNVRNTFLYG